MGPWGGGAIACDAGYLNCIDCNFNNNAGGALSIGGGAFTFTGCSFNGNAGGGVYGSPGSYDFVDCVFSNNTGGVAAFSHCSVFMVDCLFLENQGGIWADYMEGWMHLTNLTFYGNAGAAITAELSTIVSLDNSIIAFGTGGEPVVCLGGDVSLSCCDVYGNADGDWVGCISGSEDLYGNICEKPLFCDPDNSDFTLAENSPCLPGNHPDGEDCGLIGAYGEGCEPVVAVEGPAISSAMSLAPATPNPFEGSARIRYVVPPAMKGSLLHVRVYDPAGRLIRTLVNGRSRGGVHEVSWDGRSDAGTLVAGGVYSYQLGLNGATQTRRVILVR